MNRTRLLSLLLLPFFFQAPPASSAVVSPSVQGARPGGPGVRYNLGAQEMRDVFASAQRAYESRIAAITSLAPSKLTFNNTVKAFENASADFDEAVRPLLFIADVSEDPAARAASRELAKEVTRHFIDVASRQDLAGQFKAYAAKGKKLGKDEKTLLEEYVNMFRDAGSGLSRENREKLTRLQRRLTELEIQFDENIMEYKDETLVTREELDGLPESFIAGLRKTDDGRYAVGLDYPSYFPIMRGARDPDLRRRMLTKFENRAADKNVPILREMLKLRRKSAKLLGHKNHADFAVTYRLNDAAEIRAFLGKVRRALYSGGRKLLADLLALKERDQPGARRVEPWDRLYYEERLREQHGADSAEVSAYFPMDGVVRGTMDIYSELLGVTLEETKDENAWHPEVRTFAVSDKKSGRRLAWLHLDLHPRDGKYNHAAEFALVSGRRLEDGSYREPVASIVTNFPRPTPGSPSLLYFDDVVTFFHEFGHAMHETLTTAKYAADSGTAVRMDFVEMPSQLFENFVWYKEIAQRLSGHHEDPSRKLPDALFEKMRQAQTATVALENLKRAARSAIDLAYHTAVPHNTTRTFQRLWERISMLPFTPGTHPEASFGHLVGYDAGYSSYLLAEAYSRDVLAVFIEKGLMNRALGRRLRREILEKGGAELELTLLKRFLGRETDAKAFFEYLRGRGPQA